MKATLPFAEVLFFSLLLVGCGDEEKSGVGPSQNELLVDWNGTFAERAAIFVETVEDNMTIVRFRENKETFTGKMTAHGFGLEKKIYRYRNGKKHGLGIEVDKAGGRVETNYRDGVEHGLQVMFSRTGMERFRWRYDNGKKIKE
mgnify:FL=1